MLIIRDLCLVGSMPTVDNKRYCQNKDVARQFARTTSRLCYINLFNPHSVLSNFLFLRSDQQQWAIGLVQDTGGYTPIERTRQTSSAMARHRDQIDILAHRFF